MASTGQMVGMIMAILLPLVVAIIVYVLINKHSRKIETGMMGAAGYGILGYFWQELIYILAYAAIVSALYKVSWFKTGFGTLTMNLLLAVLMAALMMAGMYWGLYLTNDKQRSLYRSATIGVGFGVGYFGWTYLAAYGIPIKTAFQLQSGTAVDAALKTKVLSLSVFNMYMFAVNCILMFLIFVGITLLMGKFYLEGSRAKACLVPLIVQVAISLFNSVLPMFLPEVVATVIFYLFMAAMAAGSLLMFRQFLISKEVKLPLLK